VQRADTLFLLTAKAVCHEMWLLAVGYRLAVRYHRAVCGQSLRAIEVCAHAWGGVDPLEMRHPLGVLQARM
jgi:hypothetical protein